MSNETTKKALDIATERAREALRKAGRPQAAHSEAVIVRKSLTLYSVRRTA